MTDKEIISLIRRRRYQLLVHSYLYYDRDTNLISDDTFDKWGTELVELQEKYPEISKSVVWYDAFYNWEGSTGAFLPYRDPRIVSIGKRLLHEKFDVPKQPVKQVHEPKTKLKHKLF